MSQAFEPRAFKGKTAGILGLGKSGLACARLLARKGFKVLGSDARPARELKAALGRLPAAVRWEGGGHSDRLLKCAFVVKSPGLRPSLGILGKLEHAGIPVFSELEAALAFCKAKEVIAVTGTNGKTTTTALTASMMAHDARRRRRRVFVAGNIGIPISEAAPRAGAKDCLVLEVSSYQLEDSRSFHPQAAAILNITADHLDHHGSMARYVAAKARVCREQSGEDFCVFNAEDPIALKLARDCPSRKLFFGAKGRAHAWVEGGKIKVKLPNAKELSLPAPRLPGRHNLENAMAASLLALGRGAKPAAVTAALKAFKGVEHRLEEAGTHHGLRCINDSKATNVDSTSVALKALADAPGSIFLILGGLHKGLPYTPLGPLMEKPVKAVLTIGAAAGKVEADLAGVKPLFPCRDLETAVRTAFQVGQKGDILLLSPACASFDQFQDFEERGRRFKALVRELA